jgi:hypothetical protein
MSLRTGHGDVTASAVLIFPLLLAYEVGVMFAGRVNGADVVTRALYTTLGSRALYLAFHAVLALLFLVWVRRAGKWKTLSFEVALPLILEAAIYALTLGALITWLLRDLLGLGAGDDLVGALGAGVHEELVFRLGLLCAIASIFAGRKAFPIAVVLSSPLFALAHHVGPGGEPFTVHAFAYRTFAGAMFALIFWYRSLAHAVYAHVLYDLVVAWA